MKALTLVDVLARLLSDPIEREQFIGDRTSYINTTSTLSLSDQQALFSLDESGLKHQATTLIYKRLGVVRKILPRLTQNLGEQFQRSFFQYAPSFWPTGPNKHLYDAHKFLEHLSRTGDNHVDRIEQLCFEFELARRRLSFRFVRGVTTSYGKRAGFILIYRLKRQVHHHFIYL